MEGRLTAAPRAFGGGPLCGTRLVRFIYLDEAGVSEHEPITVVAGLVVHADSQLNQLEQAVTDVIARHVPEEHRHSFILHATDLFSSAKKFAHLGWDLQKRLEVLDDVLRIPGAMKLPIAVGYVRHRPEAQYSIAINRHMVAMAIALERVEDFLRSHHEDEIAIAISEDTPSSRRWLRALQNGMRGGSFQLPTQTGAIKKIKDALHFAQKDESPALQVVDACAFTFARWLKQAPHHQRQISTLTGKFDTSDLREFQHAGGGVVFGWGDPSHRTIGPASA